MARSTGFIIGGLTLLAIIGIAAVAGAKEEELPPEPEPETPPPGPPPGMTQAQAQSLFNSLQASCNLNTIQKGIDKLGSNGFDEFAGLAIEAINQFNSGLGITIGPGGDALAASNEILGRMNVLRNTLGFTCLAEELGRRKADILAPGP